MGITLFEFAAAGIAAWFYSRIPASALMKEHLGTESKRDASSLARAQVWRRYRSRAGILAVSGSLAFFSPYAIGQDSDSGIPPECKVSIPEGTGPFKADGWIKILPTGRLTAGEPNEIPVGLAGSPISCVTLDLKEFIPVRRHTDGTSYFVFAPTELGKTQLAIMAISSDGSFSSAQADVEVVPSDRAPAALIVQQGGNPERDTDLLRIGLNDRQFQNPEYWEHLFPAAYYLDSRKPVEISADYLQFSVKQSKDKPVIEVRPDGGVRPLRIGDALLGIRFGQITREICVQVQGNVWSGDNSRCDQLRSSRPAAPLDTVWTTNPDELGSAIGQSEFFVSRLSVMPPNHPVELAQPIRIPVTISGGKIRRITFEQKKAGSDATLSFNWVVPPQKKVVTNSDLEDGHFLLGEGESRIFELIPIELGEETVRIVARFEDGGFDERFFHLQTEPTDRNLDRIDVQYMDYPLGHPHLIVGLKYRQLQNPIIVHALDRVKLAVTPTNIVRFDADGTAHELHDGAAMVSARVGAIQGSRTVQVDLSRVERAALVPVTGEAASDDAQKGSPLIRITGISRSQGVDFGPYLAASKKTMKAKWREMFAPGPAGPKFGPGEVTIRFKIQPNGYLMNGGMGMILESPSGNTSLDRAAWGTITGSRFQPLPREFQGCLELRAVFSLN